jgi:subtilisin family serine protease
VKIEKSFFNRFFLFLLFFYYGFASGYAPPKKQNLQPKYPYKYIPGEIIIKLTADSSPNNQHLAKINSATPIDMSNAVHIFPQTQSASLLKTVTRSNLSTIYKVQVEKNTSIPQLCARLENSELVEYAEPNYLLPVEAVPNDSLWAEMWHLRQVQAPDAWDISKGDSSVVIAIIDTGVDWDHPDLASSIWKNPDEVLDGTDTDNNGYIDDIRGWDFVERVTDYKAGEDGIKADNNPMDFDGHGTFVAGVAGASTNNNIGISSLSWGNKIMPVRAGYNALSGGYIVLEYAAKAFKYAADNGADVINLSTSSSQLIVDAARYAYEKGVIITKSAGNDRSADPDPLELEPYVLSTAAVNASDQKAGYSDFGRWVKVAAPGGEYNNGGGLKSTFFDDHYRIRQGTSHAAPNVAALAGLLKSHNPEYSASDVIFQITETADDIDFLNPAYAGLVGSGRINAYRALTEQANPKPDLAYSSILVDDLTGGNGDGRLNSGESANLSIVLSNFWGDAENLTAILESDNPVLQVQKSNGSYEFIPGISDFNNNTGSNINDNFQLGVIGNVLPQMAPMRLTLTGTNGYNQTVPISLPVNPSVLLVDDDGNEDFEKYYHTALKGLHCAYEEWNVFTNGSPATMLENYDTVIWFCGLTGEKTATLTTSDRTALRTFLDNGGQLFISGQDIGWDLCDAGTSDNQFSTSNGESKNFYENYLFAKYLNDDTNKRNISGFPGDPISDLLSFTIDTPGNGYEYPSEISALDQALPVFKYNAGEIAAIRYAGTSRIVYFAFGGIESIMDSDLRTEVLGRVLLWLNGIYVFHGPLPNTDDTKAPYSVSAYIETGHKEISKSSLYWKLTDDENYHIVDMEMGEQNIYAADIPAQPAGTIWYGIVLHLDDDTFAPFIFYSFKITPDTKPPTIVSVTKPASPFEKSQLFFSTTVTDDLHQDDLKVHMDYSVLNGLENSVEMGPLEMDSVFSAIIPEFYYYGDTLVFTITANDGSPNQNKTTITDSLIVGLETFENGLEAWSVESGNWGLDNSLKKSGEYSLNDSPLSEINAGMVSVINLLNPLDFSESKKASLSFWAQTSFRVKKDVGYVEISANGGTDWTTHEKIRSSSTDWKKYNINLDQYVGSDSAYLRFRLETNSELTFDATGWYIDNVQVLETKNETGIDTFDSEIPDKYYLSQNYPNPFNPTTRFEFGLPSNEHVEIIVYNTLGQFVKKLADQHYAAGQHIVNWNATNYAENVVPVGIYWVRIKINDFVKLRKIAYIK